MATSLSPATGLRPAALVFRYGGFSHINEQLLRELRLARPDLEFVDLDLEALAPPTRRSRLAAAVSKALHYGSRRLAGRPVPADAGLKTPPLSTGWDGSPAGWPPRTWIGRWCRSRPSACSTPSPRGCRT